VLIMKESIVMERRVVAVPSYPKVMAFGTTGTEDLLVGNVRIDEKVDGSQFGFGVEDGVLVFRSHGAQIYPENCPSMFKSAVDHIVSKQDILREMLGNATLYFYAECIAKPKHNVLTYSNIPLGNMVLFDVLIKEGGWLVTSTLDVLANKLGITFIPPLFEGEITKEELLSMLEGLTTKNSSLGGTPPEGIVVKNYSHFMNIGGHVWPTFVKLVRPAFKEQHAKDWNVGGPSPLQSLIETFKGDEARWHKAIQHLKEVGQIEGSPRDIGKLCYYVAEDVGLEEKEDIKEKLWALYGRDFKRASTIGLAEWYKRLLIEA
jgi:hypothetical protein